MLPSNIVSPESELPPNAFTPEFPAQSKRLAYLLQHSNLPDKYGWVSVDILCKESGYKECVISALVLFDDDGRFIFSDDKTKVRALYGHSIKIESDAIPMPPPNVLYHGTAVKSLASIFKEGIKPMNHTRLHLSPIYGKAYFLGGYLSMPEVLEINSAAMAADGYVFYKITNDVWQTDYIPAKYITGIADLPYASEYSEIRVYGMNDISVSTVGIFS